MYRVSLFLVTLDFAKCCRVLLMTMSVQPNGRKSPWGQIPKQLHPKNGQISVTVTPSLAKTVGKRYDEEHSPVEKAGPREQAARLAQWFAIANKTAKSSFKLFGVEFGLAASDFEALQRSVQKSLDWLEAAAEDLRTDPGQLERFRRIEAKSAGTLHLVWESAGAQGGEFWGDLAKGLDGRLMENPGNLRARFVEALRGAELVRFKRCPICKQFFYALRALTDSATDSKACSPPCNDALRARRWRDRQAQHEYNRKLKLSGIKPLHLARTPKQE
jgi:hypothetical protein